MIKEGVKNKSVIILSLSLLLVLLLSSAVSAACETNLTFKMTGKPGDRVNITISKDGNLLDLISPDGTVSKTANIVRSRGAPEWVPIGIEADVSGTYLLNITFHPIDKNDKLSGGSPIKLGIDGTQQSNIALNKNNDVYIGLIDISSQVTSIVCNASLECVPATETCNGIDDNCDGEIDEGCCIKDTTAECAFTSSSCNIGKRICNKIPSGRSVCIPAGSTLYCDWGDCQAACPEFNGSNLYEPGGSIELSKEVPYIKHPTTIKAKFYDSSIILIRADLSQITMNSSQTNVPADSYLKTNDTTTAIWDQQIYVEEPKTDTLNFIATNVVDATAAGQSSFTFIETSCNTSMKVWIDQGAVNLRRNGALVQSGSAGLTEWNDLSLPQWGSYELDVEGASHLTALFNGKKIIDKRINSNEAIGINDSVYDCVSGSDSICSDGSLMPCGCSCSPPGKVLLLVDDNHHGEDIVDVSALYQTFKTNGFDVTLMYEDGSIFNDAMSLIAYDSGGNGAKSTGIDYSAISAYDLIWFTNPGWPIDDEKTIDSLETAVDNKKAVVMQGDDQTWSMGHAFDSKIEQFSGLKYINNGLDVDYRTDFMFNDHPLLDLLRGKSVTYRKNDVDTSRLTSTSDTTLLAHSEIPTNRAYNGTSMLVRDYTPQGKGLLIVTLMTLTSIDNTEGTIDSLILNTVNWALKSIGKCECNYDKCDISYRKCASGSWGDCTIKPSFPPETCNGKDDNCNGAIDENLSSNACENTNEFGTCNGTVICDNGAFSTCDALEPTNESYSCKDGIDNDCDTFLDCQDPDCNNTIDCECQPGDTKECSTLCGLGNMTCGTDNKWDPETCDAIDPAPETQSSCSNNGDLDCDGLRGCNETDCSAFSGFGEMCYGCVSDPFSLTPSSAEKTFSNTGTPLSPPIIYTFDLIPSQTSPNLGVVYYPVNVMLDECIFTNDSNHPINTGLQSTLFSTYINDPLLPKQLDSTLPDTISSSSLYSDTVYFFMDSNELAKEVDGWKKFECMQSFYIKCNMSYDVKAYKDNALIRSCPGNVKDFSIKVTTQSLNLTHQIPGNLVSRIQVEGQTLQELGNALNYLDIVSNFCKIFPNVAGIFTSTGSVLELTGAITAKLSLGAIPFVYNIGKGIHQIGAGVYGVGNDILHVYGVIPTKKFSFKTLCNLVTCGVSLTSNLKIKEHIGYAGWVDKANNWLKTSWNNAEKPTGRTDPGSLISDMDSALFPPFQFASGSNYWIDLGQLCIMGLIKDTRNFIDLRCKYNKCTYDAMVSNNPKDLKKCAKEYQQGISRLIIGPIFRMLGPTKILSSLASYMNSLVIDAPERLLNHVYNSVCGGRETGGFSFDTQTGDYQPVHSGGIKDLGLITLCDIPKGYIAWKRYSVIFTSTYWEKFANDLQFWKVKNMTCDFGADVYSDPTTASCSAYYPENPPLGSYP